MSQIEIFSTDQCPYCEAAKSLLDSLGIEYQETKLDRSPESRDLVMDKTGGMSFPQILIDGKPIGGFDNLQAMHKQGELDGLVG